MRFATPVSVLTFAALALAQNNIVINVGVDDSGSAALKFSPANVTAAVGDTVSFVFRGGNHLVAQSSFKTPCEPIDGGFDSGFVNATGVTGAPFPTFNVTVTDTAPVWFFCAQTSPKMHCPAGMVGSINAPAEGNTFDLYLGNATLATSVGIPTPALSGSGVSALAFPSGAVTTAVTPSASGAGSNATSSGAPPAQSSTGSGNNGAISTGASGVVALAAAAFGFALL